MVSPTRSQEIIESPPKLPTSPLPSFSPPKTILPRSQPPRLQPASHSHSTPILPHKASVAMTSTASMPMPGTTSSSSLLSYSQPPSTASTASSSSSFRPAITPSHSNVFAQGVQPRSPPKYGKVRALTTSSATASASASASASTSASASSSASTATGGINGLSGNSVGSSSNPALLPQTGASKMAAAAKRGATGSDGIPRPRRGSQAVPTEEDDHPLSEKSLRARDYQTFHTLSHLFHLPSRWKLIRPLGQGAYGLVISVQDSLSGEPVAVKCITRVFDKVILARRALREITLLRHFGEHDNLTGLIDLDHVWHGYNEIYLYMEPMEADLHQIVRSGQPLTNTHIQFFLYQLLRGMKYIHSANVIHRDLKPGNLLVNSDCELKICDFGLARGFRPVAGEDDQNDPKLTEYVATRWYRAPEIMMSNRRYTTAIDVWSIGCILGELIGGGPMFKGKDYVEQLNLILETVGTPDEEVLAQMGSEKACAYMRTLAHHEPKDLATVLPQADPQALDLMKQLLAFSPSSRIDVVQALSHPYVAFHHDEADEPSCPQVFDKWEQVEGLTTIEELREAITREIEEYRAEVRNVDAWSSSDEEGEGEVTSASEEEQEVLADDHEQTITASPHAHQSPTVPGPSSASTSPLVQQRDLGFGTSPKTTSHMLPPITRTRSRGRGYTPQSPALEDVANGHGNGGGGGSVPLPMANGAPISRTSSRRASGHSMSGRRPASFLFSPFGSGMTPLPSMISSQSQGSNLPSAASASASASSTASTATVTAGSGPGPGHGHSASVDYYSGKRSRAPSTTGDYSLRPLIRQLSTVGMGVGGDDGVPVAGAESSKAGLGLDGVSIPTQAHGHGHGAGGGGGGGAAAGGDDGLPPMRVSPSDEPASSKPKSFGTDNKGSGPPSPKNEHQSEG